MEDFGLTNFTNKNRAHESRYQLKEGFKMLRRLG